MCKKKRCLSIFIIITLFLSLNANSQQNQHGFQVLFQNHEIKVEIQFKEPKDTCINNFKYWYKLSGEFKGYPLFVNWKIKYLDCNGYTTTENLHVKIGDTDSESDKDEEYDKSMDYAFLGKSIIKYFYDAKVSNYPETGIFKELLLTPEQLKEIELKKEIEAKRVKNIFLEQRKTSVYNYSDYHLLHYNELKTKITKDIITYFSNYNKPFNSKINYVFINDTLNKTTINLKQNNLIMNNDLLNFTKDYKLNPVIDNVYGMALNSKCNFDFDIKINKVEVIKIKKNFTSTLILNDTNYIYKDIVSRKLFNAPNGDYKISYLHKEINGMYYDESKIIKIKGIGGPTNAFKTILIPGWGTNKVTGGLKKGYKISLITYGLIALSVGSKLYSDYEYKNYLEATIQTEMDDHYLWANYSNKTYIVAGGIAALIWISDVIWVANQGFKNKKSAKLFKENIAFQYNPQLKQSSLSFNFKF
jgi:hypothetical protein